MIARALVESFVQLMQALGEQARVSCACSRPIEIVVEAAAISIKAVYHCSLGLYVICLGNKKSSETCDYKEGHPA